MAQRAPEQLPSSAAHGAARDEDLGGFESLMPLYEDEAAFATEPGSLAHGGAGVRHALAGFISMNGTLDLEVTRVLEVGDLALVLVSGHSTAPARTVSRCGWRQGTRTSCAGKRTAPGAS
ncbi:MAG TPA: nuclear transport factor 2 family protein [Thermoleophilaceae bacterium]|nr:nuclear transport factor 2 family protein [Thermoleophilaceae bacterium]